MLTELTLRMMFSMLDTVLLKPVIKYKISMKSEVRNRLKNIMQYLM